MRPLDYFATHPLFRLEEFTNVHQAGKRLKPGSSLASVKQHIRAGNLLHIRRGIYAVVPRGQRSDGVVVDPYVLAGKLAPDAVVAYHGALQFHGKAHSLTRRVPFLTATRTKAFAFRGTEFVPVPVPPPLRALPRMGGGILERPRDGTTVRVTSLERTLVDVLDAPRHGGGWEEIWRSLESVEFFDLDAVIDYAFKLESAVAVAKVGFYLEQHREELMVEDQHLERLRERAPRRPMYLERGKREPGKLVSGWNLVVPERVLHRSWAEVA
ncbi:MAG: transcriptional regulator [Deltaproteobacteria bacterium]|nr:transcriptional regulator [Deltaproteobacteria bacterium]